MSLWLCQDKEPRCCGSCRHWNEIGQMDLARNGEANTILRHTDFSIGSYLPIFPALAKVQFLCSNPQLRNSFSPFFFIQLLCSLRQAVRIGQPNSHRNPYLQFLEDELMNIAPSVYFSVYLIYVTTSNENFRNTNYTLNQSATLLSQRNQPLRKIVQAHQSLTSHQGSHEQKFSLDLLSFSTSLGYNT